MKSDRLTKWKKGGLVFLLVVLLIPFVQDQTQLIYTLPLRGAFQERTKDSLSIQGWWSGKFQEKATPYYDQQFGFMPDFVRLRNQIRYSFFDLTVNQVIQGKEGYLFEKPYAESVANLDTLNADSIAYKIQLLSRLRDSLKPHGTELIVILPSNKARHYESMLPSFYRGADPQLSNYARFSKEMTQHHIEVFDCNAWFEEIKSQRPYPLVPKSGSHWSNYGVSLVADSLLNRWSQLIHKPIRGFAVQQINTSTRPKTPDGDLNQIMNLIFPITNDTLAYPEIQFENEGYQPTITAISDSYYWNFYHLEFQEHIFSDQSAFWYYYHTEHLQDRKHGTPIENIDKWKRLTQSDLVVLLVSEPNLVRFGYGLLEDFEKGRLR